MMVSPRCHWREGRCSLVTVALLVGAGAAIAECSLPQVVSIWGGYGSGPGQFLGASDIARDSAGGIYVVDVVLHRVQKFDENGNFLFGPGDRMDRRTGSSGDQPAWRWIMRVMST